MILIISDQFDVHANLIVRKIRERGVPSFRFNIDFESLLDSKVSFSDDGFELENSSGSIRLDEIDSVLMRRTFVEISYELSDQLMTAHKIWRGEWNKTLQGMYFFLSDVPSINPPKRAFAAENKFLQMSRARKLGLNVPISLISNDRDRLVEFKRDHPNVVLKMMYQELYREKDGSIKGLYVNKLEDELLEFGSHGENPIFLQEYIPKAYEVRYTAVASAHFACRIDSQSSTTSTVDWRRYDLPRTPYTAIEPPTQIRRKVDALLVDLGLVFGALDFVVTPEGQWYFLEVNPMGQWLWIEDLSGLPISDEIVNWLIGDKE